MSTAYDPDPLFAAGRDKRDTQHTKILQKDAETRRNSAAQSEKKPPCPKMYREPREDEEVELSVSVCEIGVMMGYASIGVALHSQNGRSIPNEGP